MSVEVRAVIESPEYTHTQLVALGAVNNGAYAFTDILYHPIGGVYDFNTECVRLRMYTRSNWVHKPVVLTHKRKGIADARAATIKQLEFDIPQEACEELKGHMEAFTVSRTGMEYAWQGARIFVEKIEHLLPTVEIIAPTQQEGEQIFDLLGCTQVLGDNVPAFIEKMLKTRSR